MIHWMYMPTILQERLAEKIIENARAAEPMRKGEILASVGYSPVTAKQRPQEVIEQKGVQEALRARGFDPENAKRVVTEIMNNEDEKGDTRLRASDMVFKVYGTYAPEKTLNLALSAQLENVVKLDDTTLAKLLEDSASSDT